jgi:PAS domain-containing protein
MPDTLSLPSRRQNSVFENVLIPALALFLIVVVDYHIGRPRVISLLSLIALFLMAFRLRPMVLASWGVVFSIVILVVFGMDSEWGSAPPRAPTPSAPYIRALTFLVGCGLAVTLSRQRIGLERSLTSVLEVLSHLPQPIIVSDASGIIILVNNEAARLAGLDGAEILGTSYFTAFINPVEQGRTIAKYVEILEDKSRLQTELHLQLRMRPDLMLTGTLVPLSSIKPRLVITVLKPMEPAGVKF